MPRPDGRSLDALRAVEMIAELPPPLGRLGPLPGRRHRGPLHGVGRREGPPVSRGQGQGLGDRRVPDAPAREPQAPGPRRARQGPRRAHAGDPASRRARAPRRGRPAQARTAHDHDRLRRPRGRRRHANGVGHRRLRRARARARQGPACGRCASPSRRRASGMLDGTGFALDLCYVEDSKARVDLNVVATASGKIVEVQGTAEGEPGRAARDRLDGRSRPRRHREARPGSSARCSSARGSTSPRSARGRARRASRAPDARERGRR